MKMKCCCVLFVVVAMIIAVLVCSTVTSEETQSLSLSTHILDITKGQPAINVNVQLSKLNSNAWEQSEAGSVTDVDGRIRNFAQIGDKVLGVYKLTFGTLTCFF